MKVRREEYEERKKKSAGYSVLFFTLDLQNPMVYVLSEMLTSAPRHLLRNYKRKYCLGNCVLYFLICFEFLYVNVYVFASTNDGG